MGAVVLEQVEFRGRGDSVGLNVDTWDHALNTDFSQAVDTAFRVRFTIAETNAGMANNVAFTLEYDLNTTGFVPIGDTEAVQSAASGQFTNGDPTTQLISTGSFIAGIGVTETTTSDVSLSSQRTEMEWCLLIDGAQVANNDTIQLRVVAGAVVLDTYTQTPTITVNKVGVTVDSRAGLAASWARDVDHSSGLAASWRRQVNSDGEFPAESLLSADSVGQLPFSSSLDAVASSQIAIEDLLGIEATLRVPLEGLLDSSSLGSIAASWGTGPTPLAAKNVDVSLAPGAQFLVRVRVRNTGDVGGTDFKWQRNLNAVGWADITAVSTVIKAVAAVAYDNDDDVPEALGPNGTYITDNNTATEDGTTSLPAGFAAGGAIEFILAGEVVTGDVSGNDTIDFRVVQGDGTPFGTYTQTPRITVSAAAAVTVTIAAQVSWLADAAARAGLRVSYRTTLDAPQAQPVSWLAGSSSRVGSPIESLLSAATTGQIAVENLADLLSSGEVPVEWRGSIAVDRIARLPASWTAELVTRGALPVDSLLDVSRSGAVAIENLLSTVRRGQAPIEHLADAISGPSIPVEWGGAVGVTFIGAVPVSWLSSLPGRANLNVSWAREQAGVPTRLLVETLADQTSAPRQMPVAHVLTAAPSLIVPTSWRGSPTARLGVLPEWRTNLLVVSRLEVEGLLESLKLGTLSLEQLLSADHPQSIPVSWLSLSLPDAILIQSITIEPEIGGEVEVVPEIQGDIEVVKS